MATVRKRPRLSTRVQQPRAGLGISSRPNPTLARARARFGPTAPTWAGITPGRTRPVAKPKAVTPPPAQGTPAPRNKPQFQGVASTQPAPTSTGKGLRVDAETNWANAQNAYRGNVFQNALQLGDPGVLSALKNDPEFASLIGGVDVSKPLAGSVWEQYQKGETEDLKGVDESRNAAGGFFSGFRLKDRADVNTDYANQRQSAVTAYQQAINELANSKNQSYGEYQQMLRDADAADIEAAMAAEAARTSADEPQGEEEASVEDTGGVEAPAPQGRGPSPAMRRARASFGPFAPSWAAARAPKKKPRKR